MVSRGNVAARKRGRNKLLQCLKGTGTTFKMPYSWVAPLSLIQSNII